MTAGAAIFRYLSALAATLGAFTAYAFLIAPRIEGQPGKGVSGPPVAFSSELPRNIKQELAGLIPPDGWEWESCNVLESPQAKLLFKSWDIADDGSVLLEPLTMVLRFDPRKGSPGLPPGEAESVPPPIVLRSPRGARLKFDKALTLSGELGNLEHGVLPGEVQIFRPSSGEGRSDAMSLVTENVQISSERILSLHDCRFRFGDSFGHGQRVSIDLPAPALRREAKGDSPFSGIERIELGSVEELYLHREETPPASAGNQDLLGAAGRSMWIRCSGPLTWDFSGNSATFQDQVEIRTADGDSQLLCGRLVILFDAEGKPEGLEERTEKPAALAIRKLHATGKPVLLTSLSLNAQLTAEEAVFDIPGRTVRLASQDLAVLVRDGQRIESPEIVYTFTEDGGVGTAAIRGPGVMSQLQDATHKALVCRWRGTFSLRDDESGRKVISLEGAAVELDQMNLQAAHLHLWMWQIPETGAEGQRRFRMVPSKLLADGEVMIRSGELEGRCAEAAAFWPEPGLVTAGYRPRERATSARTIPAQQTPSPFPQELPGGSQGGETGKGKTTFVGTQLQLKMRDANDPGAMEEITVDGEVVVQQLQAMRDGGFRPVLEIRGEQLRGTTGNEGYQRLFVTGVPSRPATVTASELALQGEEIHLDQSANRLWIDGGGEMQLTPAEGDAGSAASNASFPEEAERADPSLDLNGVVHVIWKGGMVFDGSTLYFETGVQSHSRQVTETQESITTTTTGAALSIVLRERIDFQTETDAGAVTRPSIEKLVMVGWLEKEQAAFPDAHEDDDDRLVWVATGRYDASGKLAANQELYAPRISLDVQSGEADCRGKGTVILRQLAGSGTIPGSILEPGAAGKRGGPIDFVRVDFSDRCRGNTHQKKLDFTGNVHVLYTDVTEWGAVPGDSVVDEPARRAMMLDSDELQIAQWTPAGGVPVVDLTAIGNARARGHQFDAVAERISYFEGNSLVTVEAPARGDAEFWFRQPGESRKGHLVARRVTYNLATGTYEVDQLKKMDYTQDR